MHSVCLSLDHILISGHVVADLHAFIHFQHDFIMLSGMTLLYLVALCFYIEGAFALFLKGIMLIGDS